MEYDNDFGVTPEAQGAEPEATCKHGLDPSTCKKCIDAARKREERRRDKAAEEADKSATVEQFWKAQRSLVSRETLAPMLERQEAVLDTLHWLKAQMEGTYDVDPNDSTVYVGFEEGAADLIADYEANGYVQTEIAWLDFWKNPDLLQRLLSRNDATATFARYGIITAIPDHHYNAFQKFLKAKLKIELPDYAHVGVEVLASDYKLPVPAKGMQWGQLYCATCPALPVAAPQATIDELKEKGIEHLCPTCVSQKRNSSLFRTRGNQQ
jgi:hypothetical protein